ncbi:MAG: SpoIIE family protein phosphatase [Leptospira sp.]|nr:SpoIIE family protein phosphatase [Leptospira sp.]
MKEDEAKAVPGVPNKLFSSFLRKFRTSKSLRVEIALLYTLLAIINIIFFSVMIFENQMDLLIDNFKYHSETLVKTVATDIDRFEIGPAQDQDFTRLKNSLLTNGIKSFFIVDSSQNIIQKVEDPLSTGLTLPENLERKIKELTGQSAILKSKYLIDLNSKDFTVQFLLALKGKDGLTPYLYTTISVRLIVERLRLLYFQIALAVVWGVIFHFFFAVYLFRVIFRRLQVLQSASHEMGQGNLQARAEWKKVREDELDTLGDTFNLMAGRIEDTVTKITKINEEIQLELTVGKQVQELFLPSNKIFKDFKVAVYYRPMREVSGDIYHFYRFNEKFRGFFLADATGHGVSAALVTSVIMMNLNSIVSQTIHPIKVIRKLSAGLNSLLQSSFFASAVFFIYDEVNKKILFSNAGHPSPFYYRKRTGNISELAITGGILGVSDEPEESLEYSGMSVYVEPGDRLVFYTDGVTESMNKQGEMFTLERAKQILLDNSEKTNQEILDEYLSALEGHVHEYEDDVTIIILEVPS